MRLSFTRFMMLFALIWGVTGMTFAQSEPECQVANNCGNLQIQIVKQANNTGACSQFCGDGNPFYQMPYFVYLKYSKPLANLDTSRFNLNYEMLNVSVKLQITAPTSGGRSRVNWDKTEACFKSQQLFNPSKVAYTIDADKFGVEFNLRNDESGSGNCNVSGQQVLFKYGYLNTTTPVNPGDPALGQFIPCNAPSANCDFYAALFPVTVDAYPGETIQLICNSPSGASNPNFYQSKSIYPPIGGSIITCNLNCVNGGTSTTQISQPATYTGTGNDNLELRLSGIGAGGGGINLKNVGQQSIQVDYLEFLLKVAAPQDVPVPTCTLFNSIKPEITGSGQLYYLYFKVPLSTPITLASNETFSLGEVHVSPPEPINAQWTVTLSMDETDKYRVQTDKGCTQLKPGPFATLQTSYTSTGDDHCPTNSGDPLSNLIFKVEGVSQSGCSVAIRAGFLTTQSPQQIGIDNFIFKMKLPNSNGLSFAGVDFSGSGGWTCPSQSNCIPNTSQGTCYTYHTDTKEFEMCISQSFFLTLSPDAMFTINFTSAPGVMPCVENVEIAYLLVDYYSSLPLCVPRLVKSGFPACANVIAGSLKTEGNQYLEDAQVNFTMTGCSGGCATNSSVTSLKEPFQSTSFNYATCSCPQCQKIVITPFDDDNAINGVSTFDLVLISKHLLGLEPLTSPYQLIAADVNKSTTITAADIVEERKLILGVIATFSNNTSWRFVDKTYTFPDPDNPFMDVFPETKTLTNSSSGVADFVAVKVGDINGNAFTHSKPAPLRQTTLNCSLQGTALSGNTILIPVRYTGADALEAVQVGLRFDPVQLRFIAPVLADVPGFTSDAFNLTHANQGIIKAIWLLWDGAPQVNPGDILFYLSFEVKSPLPESGADLVQLDDALLQNRAWRSDDTEYALIKETTLADANAAPVASTAAVSNEAFTVNCFPNPGSAAAQFRVQSREISKVRLSLNDASGHRLLMRELNFSTPGEQTFSLAGSEALPAGVYIWRVWNRSQKLQGYWVKQ